MAEIAALGLACNILQMVEYGRQFATTAWKIYQSGEDALEGFSSLQMLSTNLENVARELEKETIRGSTFRSSQGIAKLCQESIKTAKEMLETLAKIGLLRNSKARKHEALSSAFMTWWNEDKIRALQQRLDSLGNQVTLFLLLNLRSEAAASMERQESLMQQVLQGNQELRSRVEDMSSRGEDTSIAFVSIQWIMQMMGGNASSGLDVERLEESVKRLILNEENLSVERRQVLEKRLLQQLQYEDMDARQETVEEAHQETFRWIFDDRNEQQSGWSNFREWLDSPKQLYWITGKPGAGKSTLMKFICDTVAPNDSEGNRSDLDPKDKHLTVANFYFWTAGPNMQRSREGLYRTLLYQLLKQHTKVIAGSSPDRWEALCLFGDLSKRLTERELQSMLCRCLEQLKYTRVCLFIDGLDEFSGSYDDLVKFFSKLIEDYPVKLCLSSRPLVVFEEAFQDKPSLRIHELTYRDIEVYVASQLHKSPSFIKLERQDQFYTDDLISRILQRAEGVFLWVKLVVASLMEGLRDGDTRIETQRRLDRLPDGLEDLFHRILEDLEPEHQRKAALYLGFMRLCPEPPQALLFSFAEEDDPEFALNLPMTPFSNSTFDERIRVLRKRINTGCRGLIEVAPYESVPRIETHRFPRIQYCHRSVKDYVETPRAQNILAGHGELGCHIRLCSGNLALRKSLTSDTRQRGDLQEAFFHCLTFAAFVPKSDAKMMIRIVNELQWSTHLPIVFERWMGVINIDSRYFNLKYTFEGQVRDYVACDLISSLKSLCDADLKGDNNFLSFAIRCNVLEWVRYRIAAMHDYHARFIRTLPVYRLSAKTRAASNFHVTLNKLLFKSAICEIPNPDMVEVLLRSGANPMAVVRNSKRRKWYKPRGGNSWKRSDCSTWDCTIIMVIYAFARNSDMRPQSKPIWRRVAQLMVVHGASVSTRTINNAVAVMDAIKVDIAIVREDMDVVAVLKTGLRVLTTSEAKNRGQREIPEWQMTYGVR